MKNVSKCNVLASAWYYALHSHQLRTCNLLVPPPSTKHFPAYHSWLNLMFLSVLFCTLCFWDPNSRSIPASSTLYHLLPACCSILCYIAVVPLLLIQAKSPNPYSHLLHFGSSYKLPVSSNLLPISQRTSMHFLKHEMAQRGHLDL